MGLCVGPYQIPSFVTHAMIEREAMRLSSGVRLLSRSCCVLRSYAFWFVRGATRLQSASPSQITLSGMRDPFHTKFPDLIAICLIRPNRLEQAKARKPLANSIHCEVDVHNDHHGSAPLIGKKMVLRDEGPQAFRSLLRKRPSDAAASAGAGEENRHRMLPRARLKVSFLS